MKCRTCYCSSNTEQWSRMIHPKQHFAGTTSRCLHYIENFKVNMKYRVFSRTNTTTGQAQLCGGIIARCWMSSKMPKDWSPDAGMTLPYSTHTLIVQHYHANILVCSLIQQSHQVASYVQRAPDIRRTPGPHTATTNSITDLRSLLYNHAVVIY
jgi:hypothetical protein